MKHIARMVSAAFVLVPALVVSCGNGDAGSPAAPSGPSFGFDASFGIDGYVKVPEMALGEGANSIAIQPDGKIVVAIRSTGYPFVFAVARLLPDGAPDPSFGAGGVAQASIGAADAFPCAVLIQADGKIIVAGGGADDVEAGFALARFDGNGVLDPAFGTGGTVMTSFGSPSGNPSTYAGIAALAIQGDGKIVAAGGRSLNFAAAGVHDTDFALARYDADGSIDPSFGTGGTVTTDFGSQDDVARSVLLRPDGRIAAIGCAGGGSSPLGMALAQYGADGALDAAFGDGGRVTTVITEVSFAMSAALQPDGRIVAVGAAFASVAYDTALARYLPDGSLDATFGAGGIVLSDLGRDGLTDIAYSVILRSDGRIVTVGLINGSVDGRPALAGFQSDGSPDASFGHEGVLSEPLGWKFCPSAGALQPDGAIVMAGFGTPVGTIPVGCIIRYR